MKKLKHRHRRKQRFNGEWRTMTVYMRYGYDITSHRVISKIDNMSANRKLNQRGPECEFFFLHNIILKRSILWLHLSTLTITFIFLRCRYFASCIWHHIGCLIQNGRLKWYSKNVRHKTNISLRSKGVLKKAHFVLYKGRADQHWHCVRRKTWTLCYGRYVILLWVILKVSSYAAPV